MATKYYPSNNPNTECFKCNTGQNMGNGTNGTNGSTSHGRRGSCNAAQTNCSLYCNNSYAKSIALLDLVPVLIITAINSASVKYLAPNLSHLS